MLGLKLIQYSQKGRWASQEELNYEYMSHIKQTVQLNMKIYFGPVMTV